MASLIGIMSNKVKLGGGINLAQGIPGFEPPQELLKSLQNTVNEDVHQYAPGYGNASLVESILSKYSTEYTASAEDLLITNGATEAISLIYTYLNRKLNHLSVLAFSPAYESYIQLPTIFGDKYTSFDIETDLTIDFKKLEKIIKKQNINLIFLNTPGNPLGKIWSKNETENLLSLINKYNIYLIIDAVYREIYFDNQEVYIPFEHFSERIFYVNSFSKIFSITGWRVGYLFMHHSHTQSLRNVHDYIGLCASSTAQFALAQYVKTSNFGESYIPKIREKIETSYHLLADNLLDLGFQIPKIQGGYFIWAKLPSNFIDGYQFALDLYENQKIAVVPGQQFSQNSKNYVRINIARNISEIYQSIQAFKSFFEKESSQQFVFNKITSIKSCHC